MYKHQATLDKYQKYEVEASERIKKLFNVDTVSFNNTYEYDFITSDNLKYEVKADERSLDTGNFFIEFKCKSQPRGIMTSISDYYIISDTKNYYLISTSKLKDIFNKAFHELRNTRKVKQLPDGTTGLLIEKHIIIKASIPI